MVAKTKIKPRVDEEIVGKRRDGVSATAMELFERMQSRGFGAGTEAFMEMSPEEMGEAARKAVAGRKAPR